MNTKLVSELEQDQLDPSDPYARLAQTFPVLSDEMVKRIRGYGEEVAFADGEVLYSRGDRGNDFFVILEGRISILDHDERGNPTSFAEYGRHQFTGELDLFSGRRVLVTAQATGRTRTLRVKRTDFQRLVTAETDISETVMRAFILRRVGMIQHAHGAATLVGSARSTDVLRLGRFLARNAYPYRLLDTDNDADASDFLDCFALTSEQLPVVIVGAGEVVNNPSEKVLADKLGLTEEIDPSKMHDLVVIGAGPAGLAAAVYAASEGLETLVIEGTAPGGQAGTSSKIENYLGFPTGISGQALAGRAQVQAQKFGARLAVSRQVVGIDCETPPYRIALEDGQAILARAIVVATGARYRRLALENFDKFEGQGIHYAATAIEAQLCADEEVAIVGGGNSAGQAAMFLSRSCAHVHILVRGEGLSATMSDYLVRRIKSSPRITVHPHTEVVSLIGDRSLDQIGWQDMASGEREVHNIANIFTMIGAEPNTQWLGGCLKLDAKGFVLTGPRLGAGSNPSPYATSRPGIFAVGDVRAGSIKRVASGVGEGSVVISDIHAFLNPP